MERIFFVNAKWLVLSFSLNWRLFYKTCFSNTQTIKNSKLSKQLAGVLISKKSFAISSVTAQLHNCFDNALHNLYIRQRVLEQHLQLKRKIQTYEPVAMTKKPFWFQRKETKIRNYFKETSAMWLNLEIKYAYCKKRWEVWVFSSHILEIWRQW